MRTSEHGRSFIKNFEGLRLIPYSDAGGKDTVGYGHLIVAGDVVGSSISQAQADALFDQDISIAEGAVSRAITVPLSQEQFDALVSFQFNTGRNVFSSDTLKSYINNRLSTEQIYNWWTTHYTTAGGTPVQGLVNRRKAEADMYRDGEKKKSSSGSQESSSQSS